MTGRPTKYNAAAQKAAEAYLAGGYEAAGDVVPSAAGLACELHVAKSQVYEWGTRHKVFQDTLNGIQVKQERLLASGGLAGRMNPTICKLMLSNHGYHDSVQQDHTSSDGSMSPGKSTADLVLAALNKADEAEKE